MFLFISLVNDSTTTWFSDKITKPHNPDKFRDNIITEPRNNVEQIGTNISMVIKVNTIQYGSIYLLSIHIS